MKTLKMLAPWLLLGGAACLSDLPEVEPPAFACLDDAPLEGGELPCGPAHRCENEVCVPRLDCADQGGGFGTCPDLTRCEVVSDAYLSSVQCLSGIHVATSTRPSTPFNCSCPEGLICAAYMNGPDLSGTAFAPDLRVLPSGGAAPGVEVQARRMCVRACSGEADCTAGHTCRPALVEGPGVSTTRGLERNTVGVCYPDVIPETSATSTVVQAISDICYDDGDCDAANLEACNYLEEPIADHPVAPIGEGWQNRAYIPRCKVRRSRPPSCTQDSNCASGICLGNRCRQPCDPRTPRCAGSAECLEEELMDGARLLDRIYLCERI